MELVQTTSNLAYSILEFKKRVIKATKGEIIYTVNWININNNTCGLSSKTDNEFQANNEDLIFYIQVPANAKTIY